MQWKGGLFLIVAVISEVISTTSTKLSEGFTLVLPSIVAIVTLILAMYFLGKTLNYLPLSTAYAIWVGIGTIVIYAISIFVFQESLNWMKGVGVLLIIGGVFTANKLMAQAGAQKERSISGP